MPNGNQFNYFNKLAIYSLCYRLGMVQKLRVMLGEIFLLILSPSIQSLQSPLIMVWDENLSICFDID